MARKRKRGDSTNISRVEKIGILLALLSIAEHILTMLMFEG